MRLPDEKPDLEQVWEHYGGQVLQHRDIGWGRAKCPLHEDRHASAQVNDEKQQWRCLVCDLWGDVYDLVKIKEGIEFREAVARAAEIAGPGGAGVRRPARRGSTLLPPRPSGRQSGRRYVPPWLRGDTGGAGS